MHIKALLSQHIESAFAELDLQGPAMVQAASRPEFGDYQANGVMAAAKRAGLNPRELPRSHQPFAERYRLCRHRCAMDVAGPGFINLTLSPHFVAPH